MAAAHATGRARDLDNATIAVIEAMHAQGRYREAHESYGDLVRRHQPRAFRIAWRYLRDTADADEAVQDAFVRAYLYLPSFRREMPFDVWMNRILINRCLDGLKTRRRRGQLVATSPEPPSGKRDFWEGVADSRPSPEDQLLMRERRQQLAGLLTRLSARQRSVLMLSHCEGLTSSEVSALTGWNTSTVRVHLFRGLRNLRAFLRAADVSRAQASRKAFQEGKTG
jgi:RNA polymerase sigma-70 factor, ECF subfamily